MSGGIGYFAAFLGGLLALLSPCSALLLPAFFAYSFASRARLVARTCLFYLGLATTLVPLGAAGSFASTLFYGHRDLLIGIGGWTIIALGAAQIFGLGFAPSFAQRAAGRIRPYSAVSVYLLGMVYGLAGFCAGPILGSILTVAAVSGNPVSGGLLMAVYALGMAVPLFLLALLWDRFDLGHRRWLRGRELSLGRLRMHTTSLLSGLFFVLLGVVFLVFNGTSGLPGLLDVDQEFDVERWVKNVGSALPDWVVLVAVLVVALLVLVWKLLHPRAQQDTGAAQADTEADPPARAQPADTPDAADHDQHSGTHT